MLALQDKSWIGTLSGGCVEEEVAARAQSVIRTGDPELLTIDTLRRFGCPGLLTVFIERIEPQNKFMAYLARCISQRTTAGIIVIYENSIHPRGSFARESVSPFAHGLEQKIAPPVRVVIVGAGADTDAMVALCRILGWDVVILEQNALIPGYAEPRTALVIKNHNLGRDAAALASGLSAPFGYVGLLSSRKRRSRILNLLDEEYFPIENADSQHFYGPSGLDIGADSPEEVALSIIAEIQAVMTSHQGGFLRDRNAPIHEDSCTLALP